MHITEIILKKRNGKALGRGEIDYFIDGYCRGDIADYQASALLMAIWFNKMDRRETTDLTLAMRDSGDVIDLSGISGIKVDKHSTGGVADTTSLVTIPLVAACGGRVAKMSGRGLGHTGGTLDKLESIPGLSVSQGMADFHRIVSDCGWSIIGQTADLVPADKKLYALRSVTGTVDNNSLIAASIMSKKLASGADAIVLDVKTGNGAFIQHATDAEELAKLMVDIGEETGRRTIALISDMSQPLGNAVGNALEVREAIEILQGKHEGDLKTVALALAAEMLGVSGLVADTAEAHEKLTAALTSGVALQRLADMIQLQGGDPDVCRNTGILPQAGDVMEITSDTDGYVHSMMTDEIGNCALLLGAGRLAKDDPIDPAVGLWMRVRLGDRVSAGDVLADFHVNQRKNLAEATSRFKKAVGIGPEPGTSPDLIHGRVTGGD
ncbi:MAG: thymidine phosphorylase [Desulfobacteraceae bacterium]|nr:thymidine phosphorylase [Desulfobacteraceae bacterium]